MWFDAKAKLSEIEGCYPATPATSATQTPAKSAHVANVAGVAVSQGAKSGFCNRKGARQNLPSAPHTCSHCGKSDWMVVVATPGGKRLHVNCWRAIQE